MTFLLIVPSDFTEMPNAENFLSFCGGVEGMQMLINRGDWWEITHTFDVWNAEQPGQPWVMPAGQMVRDALAFQDGTNLSFWYKLGPEL